MDIDFSNILMLRVTTAFGIDSCSCSVIKAGPVLGFGCHVLGWCQIRCQSGHQAWGPSHSRREARASLWCIVDGFHRRETLDSWWIESHTRLWLYQCGSAQCAVCVYPVGCQPYSIAFLCYPREPRMSMFPDVSQNCAFFFGFLFFRSPRRHLFSLGVSALSLQWKVLRLGSERSGRLLLVSAPSEAQS